jgi:hypothetical protein
MKTVKLKAWAESLNIEYLTAWRWHNSGKMPVKSYQTPSGTIFVEVEEDSDVEETFDDSVDSPVSQIIKKAVEMSKSGGPVEDFATFVLSNFKLSKQEPDRQSNQKSKPTQEMTNKHFAKYIGTKKVKPESKMFFVDKKDLDDVVKASEKGAEDLSAIQDLLTVVSLNKDDSQVDPQNTDDMFLKFTKTFPTTSTDNMVNVLNEKIQTMANTVYGTPITQAEGTYSTYNAAVGDNTVQINSTLSAAIASNIATTSNTLLNSGYGVQNLTGAQGSPIYYSTPTPTDNISTHSYFSNSVSQNEVSPNYRPVNYDEARALVNLLNTSTDPLTMDRQAKEICKLNRDTYEVLLSSVQNKGTKSITTSTKSGDL